MGSLILPWRCQGKAGDFLLTGKSVDAVTALTLGLVDEVFPPEEGEEHLDTWIRKEVLPLSASSLRQARRAARWMFHRQVTEGLEALEHQYLNDLMTTTDAVEGIRSFLEKRPPEWKNA